MPKYQDWIVKLGGSLARSRRLYDWLDALAPRISVIVPGGGPFTAAAADLQRYWRFHDAAAHRMAILGMAQYGLMLHALRPALGIAVGIDDLVGAAQPPGRIWLPSLADVESMHALPADWSVSADSIALWLAARCGAGGLVLIKSVASPHHPVPPANPVPEDWARRAQEGVVDAHFPVISDRAGLPVVLYGPDDAARFIADHADDSERAPGMGPPD